MSILPNGCQVDPRTMCRPRFGGLCEGLESVFRADLLEAIAAQVEKAPIVYASFHCTY